MMRVVPELGPLGTPFWEALRDGRIVVQSCLVCGALQHPPLPRCARCLGCDLTWQEVGRRGELYAFTVVHHATHVAFSDRVPYVVGLVELAPGVRIVGRIRAVVSTLHVGMPLSAEFEQLTDEVALISFAATEHAAE